MGGFSYHVSEPVVHMRGDSLLGIAWQLGRSLESKVHLKAGKAEEKLRHVLQIEFLSTLISKLVAHLS